MLKIIEPYRQVVFSVVLVGCIAGMYGGSLNGQFVKWDDDRFVEHNSHVNELTFENVKWALTDIRFESYQPLHMISYMVDGTLWHKNPTAYKAHNLVLFSLSVLLLFGLLKKMSGSVTAAFFGALLFAAAPYRVESVAWISARKDVLALTAALGVWHVHLVHSQRRYVDIGLRVLETILFCLAVLAKSSVFVLPFMMLAGDLTYGGRRLRDAILRGGAPALIGVATAVLLPFLWSNHNLVNLDAPADGVSRVGLVFWSFGHYVKAVLWPFSLSPLYAEPPQNALIYYFYIGGGLVAVGLGCLWWFRRRLSFRSPLFGAGGMFVIALAPFLNVVPMYYWVSDRYLLFPSIAISLIVAQVLKKEMGLFLGKRSMGVFAFLVVLLGAYGWQSAQDAACWKDSTSLFELAVRRQPSSFWARMKYGETLRDSRLFKDSEAQYRAARGIRPLSPSALGGVFWAAIEQDRAMSPRLDKLDTENVTGFFISIASTPERLSPFYLRLFNGDCPRAAAVVRERQNELSRSRI